MEEKFLVGFIPRRHWCNSGTRNEAPLTGGFSFDMVQVMWWQRLILYGNLGILMEFYFTGVASLLKRNWKATGYSYLYMGPVYGFTALGLEALGEVLPWPFYIRALIYVPLIYGVEALSGYLLKLLTGMVPWEYQKSRWTIGGLIRLDYAPFWYLAALGFGPLSVILKRMVGFLAQVK